MSKGTMLGIILVLTLVSLGWAQGTPRLSIVMDEAKVNLTRAEAAGNEEIQYTPGDTIRYELKAINVGDGTMTKPVVTDPVPGGVDYIPLSAMGAGTRIEFSIDEGETYQSWPVTYQTRNARGEEITVHASADMITHIRWTILEPLNPGESRDLEFKVEVE